MQINQLRGIVIAAGFTSGVILTGGVLIWAMPNSWLYPIPPPLDLLLFLVPIAVLTFFAASKIPLNAGWFGLVSFATSFGVLAFVFGMRGYYGSLDVPFIVSILFTIAFLSGFLGYKLRQHPTPQEPEH